MMPELPLLAVRNKKKATPYCQNDAKRVIHLLGVINFYSFAKFSMHHIRTQIIKIKRKKEMKMTNKKTYCKSAGL